MADKDPVVEAGEQSIMGRRRKGKVPETKAALKADTTQLREVTKGIKDAADEAERLATNLANAGKASGTIAAPGATGSRSPNGMATYVNSSPQAAPGLNGSQGESTSWWNRYKTSGGGFGGGSFGGLRGYANMGPGPMLIGAGIAAQTVQSMVGGVHARVDRGAVSASSADKLNVLTQQMTGLSQMRVMESMRQPLNQYRIGGQSGVNALMDLQSRTGYGANPQFASSVAGISALTGYSKSTADIIRDQEALMSPGVANRMYRELGGINAYTSGGGLRDPLELRQQIIKAMGLNDPRVAKGALQPGSFSRGRLENAGLPEEMITDILQQAQAQVAFSQKGGKGDYDPRKKEHRRLMGIEENFATQQEESDRLRGQREENFMGKQIDNMAALERSNQSLIKALGGVEDALAPLVGKMTSGRNIMNIAGRGLQLAGMATLPFSGPAGAAMIVGGSALTSGDPVDASGGGGGSPGNVGRATGGANDANISVPTGYSPGGGPGPRKPLSEVANSTNFRKLDSRMRERLLAMMRENPNVGIGEGIRDSGAQEAGFRKRHRRVNHQTKTYFDGSYWELIPGNAPMAAPGRSMHEVGLAADLVGDVKWMNANAHRFGLKHFASVNNEPWHVQLAELPNSRAEWEKGGGVVSMESFDGGSGAGMVVDVPSDDSHPGHTGFGGGALNFSGMSISDIMATLGSTVAPGGGLKTRGRRRGVGTASTLSSGATVGSGGALSGAEVAALAYQAGFRGQALIDVVAISKRESGWMPSAFNGNRGTSDQSYGLMQINMLGNLGPDRLAKFGISKPEDLLDPMTNMRAAFILSGGGQNLSPWGGYKGKSNTFNTNLEEAAAIVKQAGFDRGDPVDFMPSRDSGGGGGSLHASTTHVSVTIPVTIHAGSSSSAELDRIGAKVVSIIESNVKTMERRSA